jgi:hypothetical protein
MIEKQASPEYAPTSYKALLSQEKNPVDENELIRVVGLNSSSVEARELLARNASITDIENGCLTRRVLLEAGYVFINRIGGGEKPILQGIIPVKTSGGRFEEIDLGNRVLLTQDELDAAVEYSQKQSQEKTSIDREELRRDMVKFIDECTDAYQSLEAKKRELFRAAQARILDGAEFTKEDKEIFTAGLTELTQPQHRAAATQILQGLMEECLAQVDTLFVRGIPIGMMPIRTDKLRNIPSPFLDSGYHFGNNLDVTLYPYNPAKTRRINSVTVHLLSRDVDEIGGSTNASHDQTYITASEYAAEVYKKETRTDSNFPDESILTVANRLLYRFREASKE